VNSESKKHNSATVVVHDSHPVTESTQMEFSVHTEALYLRDPDDNGVELYWERPEAQWPRTPDGGLNMTTEPLGLHALLHEAA
jgi:catechol-2,3-dioxygenase